MVRSVKQVYRPTPPNIDAAAKGSTQDRIALYNAFHQRITALEEKTGSQGSDSDRQSPVAPPPPLARFTVDYANGVWEIQITNPQDAAVKRGNFLRTPIQHHLQSSLNSSFNGQGAVEDYGTSSQTHWSIRASDKRWWKLTSTYDGKTFNAPSLRNPGGDPVPIPPPVIDPGDPGDPGDGGGGGGGDPDPGPVVYDILDWAVMDPTLRDTHYMRGIKPLLGNIPSNHLVTKLENGRFWWTKSVSSGYPWDIQLYDDDKIYLSVTELTYADPHQCKIFQNALGQVKGVPFAKRLMKVGEFVDSTYVAARHYTSCGVFTVPGALGDVRCELAGPFTETLSNAAGGNLPANLSTLHVRYRWGGKGHTDGIFNVVETFNICKPYGLIEWKTQNWSKTLHQYVAPDNWVIYNQLVLGNHAPVDPCGFAKDGGGLMP